MPPLRLKPLPDLRIPDYPDNPLFLDGQPLSVVDTSASSSPSDAPTTTTTTTITGTDTDPLTPALGIATVLYNYHPAALAAFLDLDAWISLTWTFPYASAGAAKKQTIEIGRIRNQVTFGILEGGGEKWGAVFCYDISEPSSPSQEGHEGGGQGKAEEAGGIWKPNARESMFGAKPLTSASAVDTLALAFVRDLLRKKRWEAGTGKGSVHRLYVEYAPMMDDDDNGDGDEGKGDDVEGWGGDGILMNPHWLYAGLDLARCCACAAYGDAARNAQQTTGTEKEQLNRCGRCGTAAYCSPACQRRDWAVHRSVCGLPLLDRGKMIKITEKGGLVRWDVGRVYAPLGKGVVSANSGVGFRGGEDTVVMMRSCEGGGKGVEGREEGGGE